MLKKNPSPQHYLISFLVFFFLSLSFSFLYYYLSGFKFIKSIIMSGVLFKASGPGILQMPRACCFWCKNKQSKNEFLLSVATETCQSTKFPLVAQNVIKEKANLLHWGVFKNTSSFSFHFRGL